MRIPRYVALGALLLFGCDASRESQLEAGLPNSGSQHKAAMQPTEARETIDQVLLLIDRVPLGSSYDQVKAVFPEIGKLRSEPGGWGFGSWGLTEAVVESKALGRPAKLEFNFKSGRLYGYFTCLERLDLGTANQTYEQIKKYYTHRFGAAYEEHEKGFDYAAVSSYWYTKVFDLNLVNNIHENIRSDLCWGVSDSHKGK